MTRMVVFDMAGTTVDEDNIVYKTLQKTINYAGYDFSLAQVLTTGAGKEKLKAIKDIISLSGAVPHEQLSNKIYAAFIDALAAAYDNFDIKPQPGTEETFDHLRSKNERTGISDLY